MQLITFKFINIYKTGTKILQAHNTSAFEYNWYVSMLIFVEIYLTKIIDKAI